MSSANTTSVLDRILDPVTDCFTPEVAQRIIGLRIDPALQSRMSDLADKANEGMLSSEEKREYEEYVEAVDILGILKAKARLTLRRHAP